MKINKTWKLPKPIETEDGYEWTPVVRVGRVVPFGYKQSEEDKDILIPIPEELDLLEQAKKHLKQYSYRDVAAWLSQTSGKYLSHVGLYKRIKLEQKRKTQAATQRHYAQRYKEAAEKAEKLEAQRTGARSYLGEGEDRV
jgi:hypothetical protein